MWRRHRDYVVRANSSPVSGEIRQLLLRLLLLQLVAAITSNICLRPANRHAPPADTGLPAAEPRVVQPRHVEARTEAPGARDREAASR